MSDRKVTVRLTDPQVSYLSRAFDLCVRFEDCSGVFGKGSGRRACDALVEHGLMRLVTWSDWCIDNGRLEREFPVYAPTDAGAQWLLEHGEVTEARMTDWTKRKPCLDAEQPERK